MVWPHIYSLLMCVVHVPWYNIHEEFNFHAHITHPCLTECFEQVFVFLSQQCGTISTSSSFIAFFLMEFFTAHVQSRYSKVKVKFMQETKSTEEMEKGSTEATRKSCPSQKGSFYQEKKLFCLYLLHFALQVSIQVVSIPTHIQTPAHSE